MDDVLSVLIMCIKGDPDAFVEGGDKSRGMSMELVDYNLIWRVFRTKHTHPSFNWDKRAESFNRTVSMNTEGAERTLDQIGVRPTDTVLDMGAGTGRYAIPFARRAAHLTALEPSAGMVEYLEKNMKEAGLSNYSIVRKMFEDVVPGEDISEYDIVFASNSLGFDDLRGGLEKLDAAAKRMVNILWFAGPSRHIPDHELMQRLGIDEVDIFAPDYMTIAHVLHEMGIYANISIENVDHVQVYDTAAAAGDFLIERMNYEGEKADIVREYMEETLTRDEDGKFRTVKTARNARIWWEK